MKQAEVCDKWTFDPHDDRAGGPADLTCMVKLALENGVAAFSVSADVHARLTVGTFVEVPDDLSSAKAGAYLELRF